MSIGIHHGPNGAFKTSGVVADFYIPAALEGRGVVTNIKGISRERTMIHLPECPDSHDVIYINTDTLEGRAKIANWFQWVPQGYLILFDEAGVNFPKAWTNKDLEKFDYPCITLPYCDIETKEERLLELNSIDSAETDWRPANWAEAWQKHRHWNWDIILTAPNIRYIRDDIRQTSESGYKHKNKALLGPLFKGYKEGIHSAEVNGTSPTHFDNVVDKRVPSIAFDLYDSTRTNIFKDTINGFNLFASPKVLLPMVVACVAFGYSFLSGGWNVIIDGPQTVQQTEQAQAAPEEKALAPAPVQAPDKTDVEASEVGSFENLAKAFGSGVGDVANGKSNKKHRLGFGPLENSTVRIAAGIASANKITYLFEVTQGERVTTVQKSTLEDYGYTVRGSKPCLAKLSYRGSHKNIYCHSELIASR